MSISRRIVALERRNERAFAQARVLIVTRMLNESYAVAAERSRKEQGIAPDFGSRPGERLAVITVTVDEPSTAREN